MALAVIGPTTPSANSCCCCWKQDWHLLELFAVQTPWDIYLCQMYVHCLTHAALLLPHYLLCTHHVPSLFSILEGVAFGHQTLCVLFSSSLSSFEIVRLNLKHQRMPQNNANSSCCSWSWWLSPWLVLKPVFQCQFLSWW